MPGTFIVLDGPDGAGTTTQCRMLAEQLHASGIDVLLTAEPTDGPIGGWIRQLLSGQQQVSPLALQLLFCADRALHSEQVIAPALAAGKTVICDRYWYSTVAYAEAQDLQSATLRRLNESFPEPTCVIFTLPPIEVSLERMGRRPDHDLFEREDLQRKIHDAYARMAAADPRIRIVDTARAKEESALEILALVPDCL